MSLNIALRAGRLFEEAVLRRHRSLKQWLPRYLLHSSFLAYVTAPMIYVGVIPFGLLDLFLAIYQGICFPVYGIPKVRRADYIVFDRGRLKYLNLLERLNCIYCSYANGLFPYATEVAARTEQHWCPIKHAAANGRPIRDTRASSITAMPSGIGITWKRCATISWICGL
jgi:hypothetical protein